MTSERKPAFSVVVLAALIVAAGWTAVPPARAEMVEEIVAWVNGDIITRSELELAEQVSMQDAYSSYSGAELDRFVKEIRTRLLMQLIDNKILTQRAYTIFDLSRMREALWEQFKETQQIDDDAELIRLLEEQGFTEESFKDSLIERNAPEEVLNYEVGKRVAATDTDVREYYQRHPEQFHVAGEVTIREIVILAESDEEREERRQEAEQTLGEARRIENDEAYADLVKRVSEAGTAATGGLLGPLGRIDLNDQLAEVAFSLEVGEVSGLLETPYGFHIVKIVARDDDRQLTLSEIRDQLEGLLDNQKVLEARKGYLEKIRTEAEWCVKESFRDRLPIPSPECSQL